MTWLEFLMLYWSYNPKPFLEADASIDEVKRLVRIRPGEVNVYCPITFVSEKITGDYRRVCDADVAADAIGLPHFVAEHIIAAADEDDEEYFFNIYDQAITRAILLGEL